LTPPSAAPAAREATAVREEPVPMALTVVIMIIPAESAETVAKEATALQEVMPLSY
jgi:hypothetical protein